jgi:hypothetical protein
VHWMRGALGGRCGEIKGNSSGFYGQGRVVHINIPLFGSPTVNMLISGPSYNMLKHMTSRHCCYLAIPTTCIKS